MLFGFSAFGSIKSGNYTCKNEFGEISVKISNTGLSIDAEDELKFNPEGDFSWKKLDEENTVKLIKANHAILMLTNFDSLDGFSSVATWTFNPNENGDLANISIAGISTDGEDDARGTINCK